MIRDSFFILVIFVSVLCGLSVGNGLGSLLDGVKTWQVVKLNGTEVENESGVVTIDNKDDSDTLAVSYTGDGTLSVERNGGLSFELGQKILDIIRDTLGSRYKIITSIKKGGRLLSLEDIKKLDDILEESKQKVDLYINGDHISLAKASIIEAGIKSTVLEPQEYPGYRIILTDSSTDVVTSLNQDKIKIVVHSGLNRRQMDKVKDNFYNLVAEKASAVTGLPKQLFELVISGRDEIIEKLKRILSCEEKVKIANKTIDLDKNKANATSVGYVLRPDDFPQVAVSWKNDGSLVVESKDGSAVEAIYSKGVESEMIDRIVNGLHRAITLRLTMISWSNGFLGSIPPQLEEDLEALRNQIQKTSVLINGRVMDLKRADVIELSEDSVLYGLPGGSQVRKYASGAVTSPGNQLTVQITSGLTEHQVNTILQNVNKLFLTAVQFSTDSPEKLLNLEANRHLLSSLLRGIKAKEIFKVDDDDLYLTNGSTVRENGDSVEYSFDNFENVTLTKSANGSIQIDGRERSIFMSLSTGISLEFLYKLVAAIQNVMPKKRWFYNIGNKNWMYTNKQKLQRVVDEIPNLIQEQTVWIDGKKVDFLKASILSIDDVSTVYTPDINSDLKITRFLNGDIQVSSDDQQHIVVRVSKGITSQDSQTLLDNIKKVVGDRFDFGPKKSGNFWCSSGDMRKLIGWLLNDIWPHYNIYVEEKANLSTANKRDFSNYGSGDDVTISQFGGGGVNVTSRAGAKFGVSLSTGLTQEISFELVDYLVPLLKDKEDVIRMVTGSISESKANRMKELVKKTIQNKVVEIDAQAVAPLYHLRNSSTTQIWMLPRTKKEVLIEETKSGRLEVNSDNKHSTSVSISPGLTAQQAEKLYQNIHMAFKDKFSQMTHLPIQVVDYMAALKKYFMKSYFYFSAPPKKYICVDHEEIAYKDNSSIIHNSEDVKHMVEMPQEGVKIVENFDGTLDIFVEENGVLDVIRSTGLDEVNVDRILRATEYELGLKNKMLRISSDELFSSPDKLERLEPLLKELTLRWKLFENGVEVDLERPLRVQKDESCSLRWFERTGDLVFKTCQDGQVSLDYRENKLIQIQVLPGISPLQKDFILKSLQSTIRNKRSNIKHLSNYLDTFLLLLADGRIKSLEKIIFTLIPREDIIVDGNRVNFEALELSQDQDSVLLDSYSRPGLEITRCRNGSIEVKSWNGGHLDVHLNTGLTLNLAGLILDRFKENTFDNLEPFLALMNGSLDGNSLITLSKMHNAVKQEDIPLNMTLMVDLLEKELKSKIHELIKNQETVRLIVDKAVQMQEVTIQDELVDWNQCRVVSNANGAVTCLPDNRSHVKITRYDNGRLEVDSPKEEAISVAISAGIPPKMLSSFIETINKYLKKIDSDEKYLDKVKTKMSYYVEELYETLANGIHGRRNITLDGKEIILSDDSLTQEFDSKTVHRVDNLVISLNNNGSTELEVEAKGILELDISSDLVTEPMGLFVRKHAVELLRETYKSIKNYESLVPIMTKAMKVVESLLESLEQKVFVNGQDVNAPSMKLLKQSKAGKVIQPPSVKGLKITLHKGGKISLEKEKSDFPVHILVTNGLSSGDQRKLLTNLEHTLSRFNPIEIVADVLDVLPKNFFMLAQNMDRVMSVMNLIRF